MDEDEIREMLEMLKQKRARNYGISVHHLNTKEVEKGWLSTWWNIVRDGSVVSSPGICVLI
jgi:hypothetical protein